MINLDKSKLKIGGTVITGTVEELKGKPFIKASTMGAAANKY